MSYAKPTDQYLTQRILTASPEQLMVILLEGAQRYLGQAIQAMGRKDHAAGAKSLSRVTEFLCEMVLQLNHEAGGELVENLNRIYDWWTLEVFEASQERDVERLKVLSTHMGELRVTWEELHNRQTRSATPPQFSTGDRVV